MWVRNAWYVAAWTRELAADQILARSIIDEPLAIYRTRNGAAVAFEDRCCHRFAPLSMGRVEQDDLRCMYHGMKFAPDGRCIEIPGQKLIPQSACVRRYPTMENGGWLWVWMGEADKADPRLVPPSIALTDPGYRLKASQLDYAADYQLIDDNLLDLSHLSYAHEKTLGLGTPQWALERPKIIALERGLRVQRWLRDQKRGYLRRDGIFDMWNSYDFLVPGIFLLRTAWYPQGTADRLHGQPPTEPPIFLRCDEQAVTPTTARTSRYFYATGARAQDVTPEQVDKMFAIVEAAFGEDKAIIEAQQLVIDRDPARRMLGTSFDAGPTQFRRILETLVEREATPTPGAAVRAEPLSSVA
ncbi:MAG TPA: aromatic ring-hydroxylating dioxygenase subunit alpha [Vineibacter sp.]|nr:aromatic ring-hydroxylating dioxygenase subunit alpha [Vineibacter sp.]